MAHQGSGKGAFRITLQRSGPFFALRARLRGPFLPGGQFAPCGTSRFGKITPYQFWLWDRARRAFANQKIRVELEESLPVVPAFLCVIPYSLRLKTLRPADPGSYRLKPEAVVELDNAAVTFFISRIHTLKACLICVF